MERVDAAEKEASEVLHSLLSVERVEKHGHELDPQHQQQVCILHKTELFKSLMKAFTEWSPQICHVSELLVARWCLVQLEFGLAWLCLVRLCYVMSCYVILTGLILRKSELPLHFTGVCKGLAAMQQVGIQLHQCK
jgi:hypothetical protein